MQRKRVVAMSAIETDQTRSLDYIPFKKGTYVWFLVYI